MVRAPRLYPDSLPPAVGLITQRTGNLYGGLKLAVFSLFASGKTAGLPCAAAIGSVSGAVLFRNASISIAELPILIREKLAEAAGELVERLWRECLAD